MSINEIIRDKSRYSYKYCDKSKYLRFDSESLYVPLYTLNKSWNYISNWQEDVHYKCKKNGTEVARIIDRICRNQRVTKEQVLQEVFTEDYDLYYQNFKLRTSKKKLNHRVQSDNLLLRTGQFVFLSNFMFLMDYTSNLILWTFVIKKEHLEEARILMLLERDIPEEYFELWIRKDFILNPRYKSLLSNFKKEILVLTDNIVLKNNFSDLFLNIQIPKFKTLKQQKEFFLSKSQEFIIHKRETVE
jgi:hypothetical protein